MQPGDVVPVRFGKWGGRPHWEMDLRYLGADAYGAWLGSPAGMPMRRPGRESWTEAEFAMLVPRIGDFVASFNGVGVGDAIYVDITDRPALDEHGLQAIDLDLDVVLPYAGPLYVDDIDEFEEHQVELGYPPEVVTSAQASCDAVVAAMTAGEEPWATVGHAWAARAAGQPLAPLPGWAAG